MDNNLMKLEGKVNPLRALPHSLQQILAMFVSNMVPLLLIAGAATPALSSQEISALARNAMLMAGIATFIQATPIWKIGSGLPIIMGVSFTFVIPLSVVAAYGYGAVMGAVIVGGAFEGILGLTAKYWKKMIAPIVSATVVTGIGLSLFSTAARTFGGGHTQDFGSVPHLITGIVTIFTCLNWQIFVKGTKKQISILIGLAAGYITALCFGQVDFSSLHGVKLFALPTVLPFKPEFHLDAILSACVIYIVSATETLGDASALTHGALHREITPKEVTGVLTVDGFGSMLCGIMGVTPVTTYSETIGLTIMTGVINRNVARLAALILIVCSMFPPVAAFFETIPSSAIGGVLLIVIGQIMVSGFQMIADEGFSTRNKLIASLSIGIGIGFTTSTELGLWSSFPPIVQTIFSQNVVAVIFVLALLLNLVLPKKMDE